MPLRDHFHSPVNDLLTWEEFHGGWPMVIVQQLRAVLPPGYVAGPKVHAGARVEVDVSAYEKDGAPPAGPSGEGGGAATAAWAPARPSVAVETELPDDDEYEVRVYDAERGRTLVAAIELVSPANKDRPDKRNAFVGKCAALLRSGVAVSIVDLVTTRRFNLYAELMAFVGHPAADPMSGDPPPLYAASCRWVPRGETDALLETWSHTLTVGRPLPTLPLWLTPTRYVPLDLERSYEQACRDLWIP
ncbi:MAG: DUF4058 family protein [Gemmataceae bacterium]|nr:DUF4058 family protein [Gemmataceae bacterium]